MEQQKHSIGFVTLMLAAIAGYCDTVTFVAADTIFSAHVTGNFIVFAYQLIKGAEAHAWVKLLTFPVFIIAVMTGGWIAARAVNRYVILLIEGILLLGSGIAAWFFHANGMLPLGWPVYLIAMSVVFAMGIQNAFGKLFVKETYGPTTMMTGNVTQASLDLGGLIKTGFSDAATRLSFGKQLITIGGFFAGCFLGALAGKNLGLESIIIPGVGMIICYLTTSKETN